MVARRYARQLDSVKTAANNAQRLEIAGLNQATAIANARLAEANLELAKIKRSSSGVREITLDDIRASKTFAEIGTFPETPVWVAAVNLPSSEVTEEQLLEARSFLQDFSKLQIARWQYKPLLNENVVGPNVGGVHIYSWSQNPGLPPNPNTPEARGFDAAQALLNFLHSDLNLWNASHDTWTAADPGFFDLPRNGVAIEIGVNHPDEDIRAKIVVDREAEEQRQIKERWGTTR